MSEVRAVLELNVCDFEKSASEIYLSLRDPLEVVVVHYWHRGLSLISRMPNGPSMGRVEFKCIQAFVLGNASEGPVGRREPEKPLGYLDIYPYPLGF